MSHPSVPLLAVTSVLLAAALQAQLQVEEFLIPRANAFPHDPAFTQDGACWYTDQTNSVIGRFDPVTRAFTDWPTPTPGSGPHGITVGSDGFVYYTGQSTGRIGRVHPHTGAMTEVVLPANANRPHTPIAFGAHIWFTCQNNATYGRLDPVTNAVQVYNAPAGSLPYGIFPSADGYLWIALFGTNNLGRVDPATGALRLFPLPSTAARPRRLTTTQDGYVWYTDYPRGYLGRLDPRTGAVREWPVPDPPPGAYGISTGTDGRVWLNAQGTAAMHAFDPRAETFASIPIPTPNAIVRHMVTDFERGRLWLALSGTQRIGKVELGAPAARYGSACNGSLGAPSFTVAGVPRVATELTLGVGNTAAPQAALFLGLSDATWGALPLPLDLGVLGSGGCFLNASVEAVAHAGAPANVRVPIPLDTSLGGARVFWQWALFGDPSGRPVVTTQGLRTTLIGQ
jgi:virginiamycin B lyase